MVYAGAIFVLIGLAFLLFLIFELISFIFWISMLTDAMKKKDILWIVLLIAGFLSGILSGLFAAVYYETMFVDEQGHRRTSRAFIAMIISFILVCIAAFAFMVLILANGSSIMDSIANSFSSYFSMRY